MAGMFENATSFNQDIGSWDVGNVTDMGFMFGNASAFNQDIGSWNVGNVTQMYAMFENATAFNQNIGNWNVGNVEDMSMMFNGASAFNQDIGGWEVQNVWNMSEMFYNATAFNQDIGNWNVGSVFDMYAMFANASAFNQDIGGWEVQNVWNMSEMFSNATAFNQDIGGWNVQNVWSMEEMFYNATAFDQDIGTWNVGTVTNMNSMFRDAISFNQDIGIWNVENVTDMTAMFSNAAAFDQNIGNWNVQNVYSMDYMFEYTALSTANYDALLEGWNSLPSLQSNVNFDGGGSQYCEAEAARANIISTYNWNILDDGKCRSVVPFITTWETTTPNESITIPARTYYTYDYTVDWGDGTIESGQNWHASHEYANPGIYTVKITGIFPTIYFGSSTNANRSKIKTIEQWGDQKWEIFEKSFYRCMNLTYGNVTDAPDLSNVTNMAFMFNWCSSFNGNIGDWDVSTITNMSAMFQLCSNFNQNIGGWDMSNVTNTSYMFNGCSNFDQNIGGWNVSNVTQMQRMFNGCSNFNQDIGSWVVSNVTNMDGMFSGCSAFNQDISQWDVSSVTNMMAMFKECSNFNQNIGDWNVSNVTQMERMFNGCSNFNQDISQWDVSSVTNMMTMFKGCSNFNQNIGGWTVSNVNNMNSMFAICEVFDQDIGNWDVSGVTDMSWMFRECSAFNQDISQWDVCSVTNMMTMFKGCSNFNQNIGGWTVSNVNNMAYMFDGCEVFDQDIGNWDVSGVTDMSGMFKECSAFNQDLSNWDVSNVTLMDRVFEECTSFDQDLGNWKPTALTSAFNMLGGTNLSVANYDALLIGWSGENLQNNVTFGVGDNRYCQGETARDHMINSLNWTITDGGKDCTDPCGDLTEYTALNGWSNGLPDSSKKAVFLDDYDTSLGSIEACGIAIKPGVTLTVSKGTTIKAEYNLNIDGTLIFESKNDGNGELGAFGPDGSVTGNATVQRYTSDNRAYRMISPAVTTITSIHDNWQEGAISNVDDPNPGFETHITGTDIDQQNGFDYTETHNPSMFTVNVATQQFEAIPNTDVNTLAAGRGYLMMVRGDRSIDLTNNSSHGETVLRATGSLIAGTDTQQFATQNAGDFVLFGNPYQSAVDVRSAFANSTNLNGNFYYVYDPTLAERGSYVTIKLPEGTNELNSAANQYLQPGQAAQVATQNAGPATVKFNEADKSPGQFTASNRPTSGSDKIGIQLYTTENYENGGSLHDGLAILFAQGNDNAITPHDAVKPLNFYENLGIDHGDTYLSIEQRDMPEIGEVYKLYTAGYTQAAYTLKITLTGLEHFQFYLYDSFTGTSTPLENNQNTYSFAVSPDVPLSKVSDRFSIHTEQRLSIEEPHLFTGSILYPNPLDGNTFNINAPSLDGKQVKVHISDIKGRRIYENNLQCQANTMTVALKNQIAAGIYMVTLEYDGKSSSYKLIKK